MVLNFWSSCFSTSQLQITGFRKRSPARLTCKKTRFLVSGQQGAPQGQSVSLKQRQLSTGSAKEGNGENTNKSHWHGKMHRIGKMSQTQSWCACQHLQTHKYSSIPRVQGFFFFLFYNQSMGQGDALDEGICGQTCWPEFWVCSSGPPWWKKRTTSVSCLVTSILALWHIPQAHNTFPLRTKCIN